MWQMVDLHVFFFSLLFYYLYGLMLVLTNMDVKKCETFKILKRLKKVNSQTL